MQSILKYGRQYFRKISGDGNSFGYPINGKCTLAFSRVLDTEEILVVMNLDSFGRQDYITVDRKLIPSGSKIVNLLDENISLIMEDLHGRACVRVSLRGHQVAILKKI